nr:hypothetical protein [Tanacetum cinerariifolium]
MDNKKHIVNLESFREMLHICPRLPGQSFIEPPFEEEILTFLRFLGHSGAIRRLTDVNINKLHQPWRSFAVIINKCLTGKSSGYDSLLLSEAQILWGCTTKGMNSNAYKEYYAVATGATPPKPKASVRKTRSSSDTTVTPPTAAVGPRLSTSAKGKQPATTSKAKSLSALSEVAMTEAQQLKLATKRSLQQTHISQASGSGADEGTGNGEENLGMNIGREEGQDEEDEEGELYRDVNINLGRGIQMDDVHMTQEFKDSHVTLTLTLEANSYEFMQTNQFAEAVSSIPEIVHRYMDPRMNEAVKVAVQLQSDRLRDESQKENDEFLKIIDEHMQKIIKEQVKEQVKALVKAYESDKIILDTYEDTVTLKRRRDDDADKDEEPSAGSDQGSKRRREGKEPESTSAPKEKDTRSAGKSTQGSKSKQTLASESATAEEPMTMWIQEPVGYDKHALWGISHWGSKRQQFYGFAVNWESARDVYSKRRVIAVIELKIVECDGTLTDVRTALDDRLKGIRMKYLPQSIWRKSDKDRAAAMIQAIDKKLKTRRIMRSLERFFGGRLYERDFRMLQRTI